jgi:hypothetical protein
MVGKAIEIDERERIEAHRLARGDRAPLGTSDNRPREMELGRAPSPGGQDEAAQRLDIGVHRVDLLLDPVDLGRDDAQGHLGGREILPWRRQVGTEVEQLVLDPAEHRPRLFGFDSGQGDADGAVRLVDVADGGEARIGLGDTRTVDEPGLAGITGARVDFVEADQEAILNAAPR